MTTEIYQDVKLLELSNRIDQLEKDLAQEKERNVRLAQQKDRLANGIHLIADESTRIMSGLVQASAEGLITALNHFSRMTDQQQNQKIITSEFTEANQGKETHGIFKLAVDVPKNSINKFYEVYQKK